MSYELIHPYKIDPSATIKNGSIVGKKFRKYLDGTYDNDERETIIAADVFIGYNCIIGNGTSIGVSSILDDRSTVESDVTIGVGTLLIYNCQVCNGVKIGDHCVIGGLIGERTEIGNFCRIFGSIVHSQNNPLDPWDDDNSVEASPIIFDKVFIAFNSTIAGNIKIGPKAYIMAGSVISKDVPPEHIAYGNNQVIHFSKWKGKLKDSNLFK